MNLDEFIASPERNLWIQEPGLAYYVRKSIMFKGAIELASCGADPDSSTFGYWRFLKRYEHRVPFIAEQVLHEGLVKLYRQRKWLERDIYGIPQFASPLMAQRYGNHPYFILLYCQNSG